MLRAAAATAGEEAARANEVSAAAATAAEAEARKLKDEIALLASRNWQRLVEQKRAEKVKMVTEAIAETTEEVLNAVETSSAPRSNPPTTLQPSPTHVL